MRAMVIRLVAIVAAMLVGIGAAHAQGPAQSASAPGQPGFQAFIQDVRRDAQNQGITPATLDRAFADVAYLPHVIELDRQQPETTLTFDEYIDRVVSQTRREHGREMYAENRDLLEAVSRKYGVAPRFIVALWGIESDYGNRTGTFSEIDALATLAFDGRRSTFFRKELINALVIVQRMHVDPRAMTGSWAGAMGQSQFMPSSFLNYAVSWRGDAPPDIWTNKADVFASIANYLAHVGWHPDEGWGMAVKAPPGLDQTLIGLGHRKPIADWAALGVAQANGGALQDASTLASLIEPGGESGPTLLVFNNFRVILRWNNSSYFATAVGYLADAVD
ncbi:MAG: lytic murein transglycosylase [Alphaproteobacteria bacterium]|nr:lytic murein transglycosylase [Alphaproteobacteria bacterium]